MASSVPFVKITYQADTHGIRCPYGKACSLNTIDLHRMCPQLLIGMIINARAECLLLCFCDLSCKCVRIRKLLNFFSSGNAIFIFRDLSARDHCRKISRLIFFFHFIFTGSDQNLCLICLRKKSLDQNTVCGQPRSHDILRGCFFSIYDCFNPRPVHILICLAFHLYCLHSEMPLSKPFCKIHLFKK